MAAAGHEAAEEEDQVLADEPVSLDLGQQLADVQSLHLSGLYRARSG